MPRTRPLRFRNNLYHDRSTGRWHARKMVNGNVRQLAFPSQRLAIAWLEQRVAEKYGIGIGNAGPTVGDLLDRFIEQRRELGRSPNTLEYYGNRRRKLDEGLGDALADQVDQAAIDEWAALRGSKVGAGTVKKELAMLKAAYRSANVPRAWQIPPLSHATKRRRVYAVEQVRAFWHALEPDFRSAVGLSLFAGIRAAEVWRASAEWVHGRELHVELRKTGDSNRTWIVDTLAEVLPVTGLLAPHGLEPTRRAIQRAAKVVGIDVSGPGHFRHHCATYATDLGFSRDAVKLVLGHRFGDVTSQYIHSQQLTAKRTLLEAVEAHVIGGE